MSGAQFHPDRPQQHSPIGGSLAAGAALASPTAVHTVVVTAGCARCRIYFKASAAGTLDVYPIQTNSKTARYDTKLASAVQLADTEDTIEIDLYGEHAIDVVYTPSGNGTVTRADIARV